MKSSRRRWRQKSPPPDPCDQTIGPGAGRTIDVAEAGAIGAATSANAKTEIAGKVLMMRLSEVGLLSDDVKPFLTKGEAAKSPGPRPRRWA